MRNHSTAGHRWRPTFQDTHAYGRNCTTPRTEPAWSRGGARLIEVLSAEYISTVWCYEEANRSGGPISTKNLQVESGQELGIDLRLQLVCASEH